MDTNSYHTTDRAASPCSLISLQDRLPKQKQTHVFLTTEKWDVRIPLVSVWHLRACVFDAGRFKRHSLISPSLIFSTSPVGETDFTAVRCSLSTHPISTPSVYFWVVQQAHEVQQIKMTVKRTRNQMVDKCRGVKPYARTHTFQLEHVKVLHKMNYTPIIINHLLNNIGVSRTARPEVSLTVCDLCVLQCDQWLYPCRRTQAQ